MRERDNGIDLLRALATLLVILGHVIASSNSNFDDLLSFKVIQSFHMPLFMFISGYLTWSSDSAGFVKQRFLRLVVPFFLWSFIYSVLHNYEHIAHGDLYALVTWWVGVFMSPDNGGMWFLWVLFLNSVGFSLFAKSQKKYFMCGLAIVSLYAIQAIAYTNILGVRLVAWYFPFFVAGVYCAEKRLEDKIRSYHMLLLIPLAVFWLCIWSRVIGGANPIGVRLCALGVKYLSAYTTMAILFYFKRFFQRKNNVVMWISNNSLGYYLTQPLFVIPFLGKLGMQNSSFANQAVLFCMAVAGATATTKLLRKCTVTDALLLGNRAYPMNQPVESRGALPEGIM